MSALQEDEERNKLAMGGTVLDGETTVAAMRSTVDDPPVEGDHLITDEEFEHVRRAEEVEQWENRPPWFMTAQEIEGVEQEVMEFAAQCSAEDARSQAEA
eukprot:7258028-Heterocapsa_arctica.AAC.1